MVGHSKDWEFSYTEWQVNFYANLVEVARISESFAAV